MNKLTTPVVPIQNEVVHECWYVQNARGENVLMGSEQAILEAAEVINAAGEIEPLPELGEADPMFAISDDGAEFLAAIGALEEGERTDPTYLGWRMGFTDERDRFSASKGNFALICDNARNLITAIYTLETNGVMDPAADEEVEVTQ